MLSATTVVAVSALGLVSTGLPAHAELIESETFKGADTKPGEWLSKSTGGTHTPCLTAADQPTKGGVPMCNGGATDKAGHGAMQLTNNHTQESGFLLGNDKLPTGAGIQISFNMYQYRTSTTKGGDGISVLLIDGDKAPTSSGKPGAGLGYVGMDGAWLGIGFDQFGNFSNPKYNNGGPGLVPNSVAIRGAQSTNYVYVSGKAAPGQLAVDAATERSKALRHVSLAISTSNVMTVDVDFSDGKGSQRVVGPLDLTKISGQPALPATLKFGLAASTGAATAYHEVTDVVVNTLPADLSVVGKQTGELTAGGDGAIDVTVSNATTAGPTEGSVTVELPAPPGMTIKGASGDGWRCAVTREKATCVRSDVLKPGQTYPPVHIEVHADADAATSVNGQVSASTEGNNVVSPPFMIVIKGKPAPPPLTPYVAMGDSFTSGPGIPTQVGPSGCRRSTNNWPNLLAKQVTGGQVRDMSCTFAEIKNLSIPQYDFGILSALTGNSGPNPAQFGAVDGNTKLVTLQMGGDDLGYTDIIVNCLTIGIGTCGTSTKFKNEMAAKLKVISQNLSTALQQLKGIAPNAKVVLVGYPKLMPREGCLSFRVPISRASAASFDTLEQQLNGTIKAAAESSGALFVDLYGPSTGHDMCAPESSRYVSGVFGGSFIFSPTAKGMSAFANIVAGAVIA